MYIQCSFNVLHKLDHVDFPSGSPNNLEVSIELITIVFRLQVKSPMDTRVNNLLRATSSSTRISRTKKLNHINIIAQLKFVATGNG